MLGIDRGCRNAQSIKQAVTKPFEDILLNIKLKAGIGVSYSGFGIVIFSGFASNWQHTLRASAEWLFLFSHSLLYLNWRERLL